MDSLNVRVILVRSPLCLVICGVPTSVGPGTATALLPAVTEKVPTVAVATALPARSVGRAAPSETV